MKITRDIDLSSDVSKFDIQEILAELSRASDDYAISAVLHELAEDIGCMGYDYERINPWLKVARRNDSDEQETPV